MSERRYYPAVIFDLINAFAVGVMLSASCTSPVCRVAFGRTGSFRCISSDQAVLTDSFNSYGLGFVSAAVGYRICLFVRVDKLDRSALGLGNIAFCEIDPFRMVNSIIIS